jgi:hypothetical protein
MQGLENHARAAGDLQRILVDHADGIHPPQRDEQAVPAVIRRGAAHHAAVAALRHDRHSGGGRQLDQRAQLRGVGGEASASARPV